MCVPLCPSGSTLSRRRRGDVRDVVKHHVRLLPACVSRCVARRAAVCSRAHGGLRNDPGGGGGDGGCVGSGAAVVVAAAAATRWRRRWRLGGYFCRRRRRRRKAITGENHRPRRERRPWEPEEHTEIFRRARSHVVDVDSTPKRLMMLSAPASGMPARAGSSGKSVASPGGAPSCSIRRAREVRILRSTSSRRTCSSRSRAIEKSSANSLVVDRRRHVGRGPHAPALRWRSLHGRW